MLAAALFVIGLAALFVWYATRDVVIDVPIRPLAIPTVRQRWFFWWARAKNLGRYVIGALVGLILLDMGLHLPSGQSVHVASDAGSSRAVQAGVLATMADYFSGLDAASLCRYTRAFSPALHPPPFTDCNVTLSSGTTVTKIENLPNGSLDVQADLQMRHLLPLGMSLCTPWTGSFVLRKENGNWLIVNAPQLKEMAGSC